jgi:hypothetical protein
VSALIHQIRRAAELNAANQGTISTWSNSPVTIDVLTLQPTNTKVRILDGKIVYASMISTPDSGSLWCGHPNCYAASFQKSDDIHLPWILRGSRIPCLQFRTTTIEAMPDYAAQQGIWADYGNAKNSEPARVHVAGLLIREHAGY